MFAQAEERCMTTPQDLLSSKEHLPAIFQNLPIHLKKSDNKAGDGAIKIYGDGARLKLEGFKKLAFFKLTDTFEIKQICHEGSSFKITFANGKTETFQVDKTSVLYDGYTFSHIKETDFKSFAALFSKGDESQKSGAAEGSHQ